jgi:hypothetical protein
MKEDEMVKMMFCWLRMGSIEHINELLGSVNGGERVGEQRKPVA